MDCSLPGFSIHGILQARILEWLAISLSKAGSPCSPKDSQESSPTPQFKSIISSVLNFLYSPVLTSTHDYWKKDSFDQRDLCVMSLLFNRLSRLVIVFLPRSKRLLLSWLQSPSAVILEPKKIKSVTVSIVSIYLP